MKSLEERMIELKGICLSCWADEYGDIGPQYKWHQQEANDELRRNGYPACKCNKEYRKSWGVTHD